MNTLTGNNAQQYFATVMTVTVEFLFSKNNSINTFLHVILETDLIFFMVKKHFSLEGVL